MPANESESDLDTSSSGQILRSSHPWTKADSAAGFVLRYVGAMRAQLLDVLDSEKLSDHAMSLFIGHLVSKGFGANGKGKLRDFLMRGVRSAAKATIAKLPPEQRDAVDLDRFDADSDIWKRHWRAGLLELSWRSLEQFQHKHPDRLDYTVLRAAMSNPQASPAMLAVRIGADAGIGLDPERVTEMLNESKAQFVKIVTTEVANTLHEPNEASVAEEMKVLGLP